MSITVKKRLIRVADSYAFIVPKALWENRLLIPGKEYNITIKESAAEGNPDKDHPDKLDDGVVVYPRKLPLLGDNFLNAPESAA